MSDQPKPTTGEADRKLGKMRIPNDTLWNAKPTPTTGEWTAQRNSKLAEILEGIRAALAKVKEGK